ncbi:MAG: phage major capsid protein, partial [Spirochaetota bacterium]|nr:phage major capsid protein [Spirochaetota bacterium]
MDIEELIKNLKEKRQEIYDQMDKMLNLADSEKRDLTEEETGKYADLERSYDKTSGEITKLEEQLKRKKELNTPDKNVFPENSVIEVNDPNEFRNLGEFLYSARFNQSDPRLKELRAEQSMGEGTAGGFMVPTQFRSELLKVDPQSAHVRPRATVIDAGTPPDAEITMPSLNQGSSSNM